MDFNPPHMNSNTRVSTTTTQTTREVEAPTENNTTVRLHNIFENVRIIYSRQSIDEKAIKVTRAPPSAKEIERQVLPKILSRYHKKSFFNDKLVSTKHAHNINRNEKSITKIVKEAAQQLAQVEVGQGVIIQRPNHKGTVENFYVKLKYNKNNQLRLVIQKDDNIQIDKGANGSIASATALHIGKQTVRKTDNATTDWDWNVEYEYKILSQLQEGIQTLLATQPGLKAWLMEASPNNEVFIPIIKHSSALEDFNGKVTGIYMERAPHGGLLPYCLKNRLKISQLAQYSIDLLIGLYLLQLVGIVHLDIKIDNMVIFDAEPNSRGITTRAKLIDFGFSMPQLTEQDIKQTSIDAKRGTTRYIDLTSEQEGLTLNTNKRSLAELQNILIRRDRVAAARTILLLLYSTNPMNSHRITAIDRYGKELEKEDDHNKIKANWVVDFPKIHNELKKMYEGLTARDPSTYDIRDAIETMITIRNNNTIS